MFSNEKDFIFETLLRPQRLKFRHFGTPHLKKADIFVSLFAPNDDISDPQKPETPRKAMPPFWPPEPKVANRDLTRGGPFGTPQKRGSKNDPLFGTPQMAQMTQIRPLSGDPP